MRRVIEDCFRVCALQALRDGRIDRSHSAMSFGHEGRTYDVGLVWRSSPVGGSRPNLLCPHCRRLKIKLAIVEPWQLRCQPCSGLPHRSRQATKFDRAANRLRRAQRLTGQRNWENIEQPYLWRPRGMRRRKFEELAEQARSAVGVLKTSPWARHKLQKPLLIYGA